MPGFPVARTPQVLKYVRYFSESPEGRKTFSEGLRRSGRFEGAITKSLRELGLPAELMAVAFVESGFSTEALSTAGAAGLWQFMPGTARAYGLTIESTIDERASIWRSTDAAAHHLADLYERFRSWELALAAYNLGYDALERRLDDFETDDFWTLADAPGGLPKETAHYVPKVLAAAVVFANLEELGFGVTERAAPIDAAELEVPGGTKLAIVARAAGTSLKVVRELNPELLADVVPDRGMPGVVHVPKGGLARAHSMLPRLADDVEAARVSDDFDWGKDEMRSGRSRLERTSAIVREPRAPRRSRRHVSAESRPSLRRAELEVGEKERILERGAERAAEPLAKVEPAAPAAAKPEIRVLYRVMAGDSLEQIGQAAGLTVDQVLAQAHVSSAAQLQVGTLLDLRGPGRR